MREGEQLVVSVPLAMKRRGGRKQVIVPGGAESGAPTQSSTNAPLALTIARAHRWRELLEQGRYASIRALAQQLGVDNSYAARLLRLSLLAPDIVEAILDGAEPSGISLGEALSGADGVGRSAPDAELTSSPLAPASEPQSASDSSYYWTQDRGHS